MIYRIDFQVIFSKSHNIMARERVLIRKYKDIILCEKIKVQQENAVILILLLVNNNSLIFINIYFYPMLSIELLYYCELIVKKE